MNCKSAKRNLSPYQDGGLNAADAARLHDHLMSCTACHRLAEGAGRLNAMLLKTMKPLSEPTADFEARFWTALTLRPKRSWLGRIGAAADVWLPVPEVGQIAWILGVALAFGVLAGAWSARGGAAGAQSDIAYGYSVVEQMPPTFFAAALRQ